MPTIPDAGTTRHPAGCLQPVLLRGRVDHIDGATGELLHRYTTVHEPGGLLPIACKTRRAARCPPCAEVYRADTYQLIRAGLSGGKGIPDTVATHPCVFTTLTAPSFGPVHVHREKDGLVLRCRPRRRGRTCPHGNRMSCPDRHARDDTRLGEPLCPDCNVRKLPSGRYQVRYPGPDGRLRSHPQTFERKGDAERALSLVEAQIIAGEWTDPQRGKAKLGAYARGWITHRPGLRVRTVDFYRWLLAKHIEPYLGDVPIGKLSTQTIREWRSGLLARGVSATMTAKAYRLLRAVLMTAVEEDKILPRNPCRIRGAGSETAPERPVLTVAQVFELAELVGRRPVGNIRQLAGGGYRLRFQRNGEMRTAPEVYRTRADAERALWAMALDGRADCNHDRRYRAFVLLATFASLRWGEVTALRRCDLDLDAGTVRVRVAYAERSTGEIILGPPKSKAGRRIVGIPQVILPELRHHLAVFVKADPGALAFPGAKGGPLRRGNFNRSAAWPQAVAAIGAPGLHFHDLRHTGNTFAAAGGAGLRDLMARMGHDSERAALIYQHEARGADTAITNAIDAHVDAERSRKDDDGLARAQVTAG